jgi:hypothetical protein
MMRRAEPGRERPRHNEAAISLTSFVGLFRGKKAMANKASFRLKVGRPYVVIPQGLPHFLARPGTEQWEGRLETIFHPGPKDYVTSPFRVTGSVDPPETPVRAIAVLIKTGEEHRGHPVEQTGPVFDFEFSVPPGKYEVTVAVGQEPYTFTIRVIEL